MSRSQDCSLLVSPSTLASVHADEYRTKATNAEVAAVAVGWAPDPTPEEVWQRAALIREILIRHVREPEQLLKNQYHRQYCAANTAGKRGAV